MTEAEAAYVLCMKQMLDEYRAFGTVEELEDLFAVLSEDSEDAGEEYGINLEIIKNLIELKQYRDIGTLEELKEYREIGTVEECWENAEKQKANKVKNRSVLRNYFGRPYSFEGDCPRCGCGNLKSMNTDYCVCCGQKLDWEE